MQNRLKDLRENHDFTQQMVAEKSALPSVNTAMWKLERSN